jgi:hypothetical protein
VLIGTSIDIALPPADGENPDQLLKNADLALYRAKSEGRGAYRTTFRCGRVGAAQPPRGFERISKSTSQQAAVSSSGDKAVIRGKVPPVRGIDLTLALGVRAAACSGTCP